MGQKDAYACYSISTPQTPGLTVLCVENQCIHTVTQAASRENLASLVDLDLASAVTCSTFQNSGTFFASFLRHEALMHHQVVYVSYPAPTGGSTLRMVQRRR